MKQNLLVRKDLKKLVLCGQAVSQHHRNRNIAVKSARQIYSKWLNAGWDLITELEIGAQSNQAEIILDSLYLVLGY